ncbi:diguanylate cyclase (plasmid) [Ilyobacter polytropus DSM 2926]|uniref:Diguanylate cyclase n=2 Tax=Ilyobacter TaxID=167639 RepID=E3HDZ3_ILYPC|nr:diguanylate cyclase [Ilyobacter polytropus DSM 2926]
MDKRTKVSYLICLIVTIILTYTDMSFPKLVGFTSWDIVSELLICIQPIIWIYFVRFDLGKNYFNRFIIFGFILFYAGSFQNVMDEIYEMEGFISNLDKILMPIGLMTISTVTILSFMNQRKIRSTISDKSMHDHLTGLYNRHYLELNLDTLIKKSLAFDKEISIAFIDLDNFKNINDKYGHKRGDEVLEFMGKLIKSSIRETDNAIRYGGDEFIILYQDTSTEKALEITERINTKMKKNDFLYENKISISSGIVSYQKNENWKELINRADKAMYDSKKSGKDKISIAL